MGAGLFLCQCDLSLLKLNQKWERSNSSFVLEGDSLLLHTFLISETQCKHHLKDPNFFPYTFSIKVFLI